VTSLINSTEHYFRLNKLAYFQSPIDKWPAKQYYQKLLSTQKCG